MNTLRIAAASIAVLLSTTIIAEARHHRYRTHRHIEYGESSQYSGNGIVRSHKTGAMARVGVDYAAKFQAYVDDLEAHGATIRFMGGNRAGHCSSRHMHSCGRALDICQLGRDRVDSRCHLPVRSALSQIASAHGLFEGGQWCNGDMGHAQAGVSAPACGTTMMARTHHRHRRIQVAYYRQETFMPVDRFGAGSVH